MIPDGANIVIASSNPVKAEAVRMGFEAVGFGALQVASINVNSGVSRQPMSDEETLRGAINRMQQIRMKAVNADFWVGIEGGLVKRDSHFEAYAWIVIGWKGGAGQARTTSFQLPGNVTNLIEEGHELGTANDMVFEQTNSKQKAGAVGILTRNLITRAQLYKQAVILALVPYINREIY
jgi:inosine/xanthosine triphosphatase